MNLARRSATGVAIVIVFILCGRSQVGAQPSPAGDAYARGYAAAILEREFNLAPDAVMVVAGVATVDVTGLPSGDRGRAVAAVSRVRGIVRVEVVEGKVGVGAAVPAPPGASSRATASPAGDGVTGAADGSRRRVRGATDERRLLPRDSLFDPLMADPKWPHFSAAYRYYIGDEELKNVGAANFGESFSFYQTDGPADGRLGFGAQAGLFAIFDFDADSTDLVNADYFVALTASYRREDFSLLARVFHQSSHLGDEYLLRNRVERVNLSYEGVGLLASYDLNESFRVYGGGGYLFRREPSELKPWSVQYGLEYESPWKVLGGALRPVAAIDVQHHEESDWDADLSIQAGVQIEDPVSPGRRLRFVIEYFNGHSPNGQFYERDIQYLGFGIHLHL